MRWRELGVRMVTATRPLAVHELSAPERAAFERVVGRLRRDDWLLGRAALKRLLGGADTSAVGFPHPRLSLTHAGGVAVAAAADDHSEAAGLGVDYELWRRTDPRIARFFLHEDERLEGDLLRLWTVKEALFKATPANHGAQLLDYRLAEPAALAGSATDVRGHQFQYACKALATGALSVAICLGRTGAPF